MLSLFIKVFDMMEEVQKNCSKMMVLVTHWGC